MADTLLSGKYFVVTGGTQGLGRGIALHLSHQGAAGVVICGRNQENGRAAAQEISKAGTSCTYVPADLAVEADCRAVVTDTLMPFYLRRSLSAE